MSYNDGDSNMLCAWVPISEGPYYAKLQYIDKNGIFIGDAFYTDDEEEDRDRLSSDPVIGIAGDNNGSVIIAYRHKYVPEPGEYDPGELGLHESVEYRNSIGYRIFGEPQPPEPPALVAETEPDLAYHSGFDIYLSVFTGENYTSDEGECNVYGQLIDNKGKPIGERFLINDGSDNDDSGDGNLDDNGQLQSPSVAVDNNGDFLVAWTQGYTYSKIYASKVSISKLNNDSYNVEVGDAFRVSYNTDFDDDGEGNWRSYDENTPDIAYNSEEDNFLIVWTQYMNDSTKNWEELSNDIYGSIVDIEGVINNTFSIADGPGIWEEYPSVSYSSTDNKYLVAWQVGDWYQEYCVKAVAIDYGDDEVYPGDKVVIGEGILNPSVSYNYEDNKFLITWSDDMTYEIMGAYYSIQNDIPEIINEEFVISAISEEVFMGDVFPAAYFDGKDKMLCVWNPGSYGYNKAIFGTLYSVSDDYNQMYAKLRYIGNQGPVGETFITDNPEITVSGIPIAITGNLKGDFLIAYQKGQEYGELYIFKEDEDIPTIGYRIISEPKVKPPTRRDSSKPEVIGQIIVDDKVLKNIYSDDLGFDEGTYSFEATKAGDVAKLWLSGTYYKKIAKDDPKGILQFTWNAASYNLPLKSNEVLNEVNNIEDSKVIIILEKADDKELIESAIAALDKLGGKMVSGLVDFSVTVEGKSKETSIGKYDVYVSRTIDELNTLDTNSTSAMKLIGDEFTFAPSLFNDGSVTIKYRGNGIFAIVNNQVSFSDITNHWSKLNVERLAARNIAFGKSQGIFAPDDYVTRAEFAVMIARALAITEEEGTVNFEDVNGWFEEDISTAYSAGIVNGRGNGKFYPNERIQRKDMAVMICNAIKFAGKEASLKNTQEILSKFVDNSTIDEYARESVARCADAGIIMGRDTMEFDPDKNATRAEASAIIERMLRYLEFIN